MEFNLLLVSVVGPRNLEMFRSGFRVISCVWSASIRINARPSHAERLGHDGNRTALFWKP